MMEDQILVSPEADIFSDSDKTEWHTDYNIHSNDVHNLQRPETVESLFYMWRITEDEKYRHWGWEMFQSFVEHTVTEDGDGFSSINNVDRIPSPTRDNMESFWLVSTYSTRILSFQRPSTNNVLFQAETLKYFYLLFGPTDVLPLDQVVFNTEAHAFPTFELGKLFKTGWERKPRDAHGNLLPATGKQEAMKVPDMLDAAIAKIQTVLVHSASEAAETLAAAATSAVASTTLAAGETISATAEMPAETSQGHLKR